MAKNVDFKSGVYERQPRIEHFLGYDLWKIQMA
jgi:hypothetical protein